MIEAQRLLADCKCALNEGFSLSIPPLIVVQQAKVAEHIGHVGMISSEGRLCDFQAATVQGLGLRIEFLEGV